MALAACLAVIIVAGVLVAPSILQGGEGIPDDKEDNVTVVSPLEEYGSAEELSQAAGFEIEDIEALPFQPTECVYMTVSGYIAEIDYTAEDGSSACYRKAKVEEDISGVYGEFETEEISVEGVSVTLKGADGVYVLALWSDGDFSYSLYLTAGMSEAEWPVLVESVMRG